MCVCVFFQLYIFTDEDDERQSYALSVYSDK